VHCEILPAAVLMYCCSKHCWWLWHWVTNCPCFSSVGQTVAWIPDMC